MDELKIKTHFMKSLIGKVIEKILYKNKVLGEVKINDISLSHVEGNYIDINLSLNVKLAEKDIWNLLTKD